VLGEMFEGTIHMATWCGQAVGDNRVCKFGVLDVISRPAQVEVHLDGSSEPVGTTDLAVRLIPGTYRVRLRQSGKQVWQATVVIQPGIVTRLQVRLENHSSRKSKRGKKLLIHRPEKLQP